MFDCHCDLLTYIYINKNNIQEIKKTCEAIYNDKNIIGAIFNLFFMSKEEMKQELQIEENEIDVIKMLKEVDKIIKEYNIIPKKTKYIYGIEGLDYIEKISDIDILYNLGVRSVNIVWNNNNQFGGGTKTDNKFGLTNLGEELVEKLVKKGIKIDLSHTNQKTFYDIIEKVTELKKSGYTPKIFASHSNCKKICDVKRNLTDEQIIKIKEMNGIIGIVEYKDFICKTSQEYEKYYLKHINYLKHLLDGIENIAVSTDDELYYNKKIKNSNLYNSKECGKNIKQLLLKNGYNSEDTEKILRSNVIGYINKK